MTSLSTHDTKRGEDVRARLAVLSELPDDWGRFAEHFLSSTMIPNRAFGYFLAQSLAGTGPIERQRMHHYAEGGLREASDDTLDRTVPSKPQCTPLSTPPMTNLSCGRRGTGWTR